MNIKYSKLVIMFLFGVVSTSSSQDLNLNYSSGTIVLPLDSSQNMSIDPSTGNINLFTTVTAENIGDELGLEFVGSSPVVSLSNSPVGTTSSNINYTILNQDAVYCQKSNAWSGTYLGNPLVADGSENVTSNGTYALTCTNSFGTSNMVSTSVTSIQTILNPTLSFNANPTSVLSGESSTLTWVIGNSPTSCTKSGDWSGSMSASEITNGSHQQVITNITSSKTYNLICDNSALGDSGLRTASISLSGNPNCNTQLPILNGSEDLTPNDYEEISPGSIGGFPGTWGSGIGFAITRNQYVALEFNSGNTVVNQAKFSMAIPGNGQGAASTGTSISFSECPGDFSVHLNQDACLVVGGGTPSIRWSIDPSQNSPIYCNLDPNTQYYMNIVHSNSTGNNYSTTSCGSGECGVLMSASILN